MQDLSVSRLEELASFIGNSAMAELMNAQGGETATVSFQLPEGGLETAAYPVPSGAPALAAPVGLTGEMSAGRAFDPGGLRG